MPNTSHYKIFDYWKEKVILSSGEVESFPQAMSSPGYEPVIWDWGEPCCWACGRYAVDDKELLQFVDNNPDTKDPIFFKKLYELKSLKHELNRCHIQPKSLGGEDSPENLFLMCEKCHIESPDTTNRAAFFRWVYDKRKAYCGGRMTLPEILKRLDAELSRRGLPSHEKCFEMLKSPGEFSDIEDYMETRVTSHWSKISESSMIVGLADWFLYNWTTYLLKD